MSVTKGYQDLIRKLLKGVWLDKLDGATAKTPHLNLLRTKLNLSDLRAQSVPRSKHSLPRL